MSYANKDHCRIRTITTFLTLTRERNLWRRLLEDAALFCHDLAARFLENGYLVQSVRIVTNPFGEYLNTERLEDAKSDLAYISSLLHAMELPHLRIRFAIGEARSAREISLLPALIAAYGDLCNACVNISKDPFGTLDNELIEHAAHAVVEISRLTPRGEGNFNFTVNFNCNPLIPYFPASYHKSEQDDCFVVGLETPDLLVDVLRECNAEKNFSGHNESFGVYYERMRSALQHHITDVTRIVGTVTEGSKFKFAGVDSSAAPSKNCSSMVDVYKLLGVEYFGASGTVEASSLLTRVFQAITGVSLVGFSGLMLAVTEDTGLAAGTQKAEFDIRSLLTYSAVCGIGLDTVPIPGNTPLNKICALMRDTGTMAFRLNKPLTVRLFPVPGLTAGEITSFESDDLCNCAVLAVP